MWQCVAVCCGALQCVAVRRSALHWPAVSMRIRSIPVCTIVYVNQCIHVAFIYAYYGADALTPGITHGCKLRVITLMDVYASMYVRIFLYVQVHMHIYACDRYSLFSCLHHVLMFMYDVCVKFIMHKYMYLCIYAWHSFRFMHVYLSIYVCMHIRG